MRCPCLLPPVQVMGLGESLVSGMIAGSAIAFKANKASIDTPEVRFLRVFLGFANPYNPTLKGH